MLEVVKPSFVENKFVYNGELQTVELPNSDNYEAVNEEELSKVYPGSYNVEIRLNDVANTKWKDGDIENIQLVFEINKKKLMLKESNVEYKSSKVYNENNFANEATVKDLLMAGVLELDQADVEIELSNGLYNSEYVNEANSIKYDVVLSGDNSIYYEIDPVVTLNGEIIALEIEKPTLSETEFLYDGTIHEVEIANSVYYEVYDESALSYLNAGEYNVEIQLVDKNNTKWKDGDNSNLELPWKILKKKLVLTVENIEYESSKVFSGDTTANEASVKNIVDSGVLESDKEKVLINLNNGLYNSSNVKEANKITYEVSLDGEQSVNYDVESTLVLDGNIIALQIVKPVLEVDTFEYSAEYVNISYHNANDRYSVINPDMLSNIDAGNYTVEFALLDKENTEWKDGDSSNLKIEYKILKKELSLEKENIDYPASKVFDGTNNANNAAVKNLLLAGVFDKDKQNVSIALNNGLYNSPNVADAAKIEYQVLLTGDKSSNYKIVDSFDLDSSITILELSKPEFVKSELVYNGESQTVELPESDRYQVVNNEELSRVYPGSYNVEIRLTDLDNTKWADGDSENIQLTFKINKKKLNLNQGNIQYESSKVYNGNNDASEATIKDLIIAGVLEVDQTDVQVKLKNGAYNSEKVNEATTVKYDVVLTGDKSSYYEVDENIELYAEIIALDIDKPILSTTEFIYDGANHDVNVPDSLYYKVFDESALSKTDAGEYTVEIQLVDKDNTKWKDGDNLNLELTWKILKKKLVLTSDNIDYQSSKVFTGDTKVNHASVKDILKSGVLELDKENLKINLTNGTYNSFNVSEANKITYEVSLEGEKSGNYEVESILVLDGNITILEIQKPTLKKNEFEYTGETISVEFNENSNRYSAINGNNNKNPGTYILEVELLDKNNTKWKDGDNSNVELNWIIRHKNLDKPIKVEFVYNGKEQKFIEENEGYTLLGNNSGVYVGEYNISIELNDGYKWNDGTSEEYSLINKIIVKDINLNHENFKYYLEKVYDANNSFAIEFLNNDPFYKEDKIKIIINNAQYDDEKVGENKNISWEFQIDSSNNKAKNYNILNNKLTLSNGKIVEIKYEINIKDISIDNIDQLTDDLVVEALDVKSNSVKVSKSNIEKIKYNSDLEKGKIIIETIKFNGLPEDFIKSDTYLEGNLKLNKLDKGTDVVNENEEENTISTGPIIAAIISRIILFAALLGVGLFLRNKRNKNQE